MKEGCRFFLPPLLLKNRLAVEERGSPGMGACLLKCTVVHMPPSLQLVVLPVASTASARAALLGNDGVVSQEFL